MSEFVLVYITAANEAEAVALAKHLVESQVAACANILGPIRSIYRWEGAVRDEPEVALIAKTRAALVPELTMQVKVKHSYSVPCVVALPIEGGNPDFLHWLGQEAKLP